MFGFEKVTIIEGDVEEAETSVVDLTEETALTNPTGKLYI